MSSQHGLAMPVCRRSTTRDPLRALLANDRNLKAAAQWQKRWPMRSSARPIDFPLRLHQLLPADRQRPQARTRSGKNRVAEGGSNQRHGGFADAAGRLGAVHEMTIELGQFAVAQQPIAIEVWGS